ncbi:sarcosine oxidase subunit gamma [Roseobacter sinensis]|uniref:Sarcosine oxidase subunit gamma n=1 Tax=Roseobacter sinensis TaxID=2931391 RepID=A0ABT3BG91_9RHOB|nr:sarcosine oxidase subunit gamma family protein [Roseobacter sp. WL0113]MCV3272583.1 sarcosine oxidase subunit gamma [Roseobacter sp. WL0113]
MSEPVTALGGVSSDARIAAIAEAPLQGMITLRADLSDSAVKKAAKAAAGADVPGPGTVHLGDESGLCWMSPDELLLLCPYAEVTETLERLQKALVKTHALAVNVSDARASFTVTGPRAREVMGKLCPVDFAPDRFAPGMFRRTRMAQVPAAIWMSADETFRIVCFRSQAQYVFDLLTVAAQPGSEVFSDGKTPALA